MKRFPGRVLSALLLSLVAAGSARASLIEIQFSGVDLTYNGSDLFDSGVSNTVGQGMRSQADPLTNLIFLVDGVQIGSLTSDIGLDLYIKGLTGIPAGGGSVVTAGNGDGFGLDLLTKPSDPGWGLALQIDKVSFFYTGSRIAIALGGQSSSLYTQSLPFDLKFDADQPISIALSSANLSNVTTSGGYVTGFHASGTGNISGTGSRVPEPATLLVLAAGAVGLLRRRKA